MIKPEMVPDNVEEHFRWCCANTDMTTRECIAAALNAWPGMATEFRRDRDMGWDGNLIILPLAQKQEDGDGR